MAALLLLLLRLAFERSKTTHSYGTFLDLACSPHAWRTVESLAPPLQQQPFHFGPPSSYFGMVVVVLGLLSLFHAPLEACFVPLETTRVVCFVVVARVLDFRKKKS